MRIFKGLMISLVTLMATNAVQAEQLTCDEVAQQMLEYSHNKKADVSKEWLDTYWLKKHFDVSDLKKSKQETYRWDKFILSISDGRISSMPMNTDPSNPSDKKIIDLSMREPTLAQATHLLGEPKKRKNVEIAAYLWNCPDSKSNFTVSVMTNRQNGKTATVYSGHSCQDETSCKLFKFSP